MTAAITGTYGQGRLHPEPGRLQASSLLAGSMRVVKEFFAHPIIQIALALGASTVILAYYSKRVLDQPLRNWELGLPAFLAMLFQGYVQTHKSSRFSRSWIGILAVVLATVLVIVLNS